VAPKLRLDRYVAATVSLSRPSIVVNGEEVAGELARGISLMAGKEWWVNPHWGVGAAVQLYGVAGQPRSSLGGGGDNDAERVQTVAIMVSSSYDFGPD